MCTAWLGFAFFFFSSFFGNFPMRQDFTQAQAGLKRTVYSKLASNSLQPCLGLLSAGFRGVTHYVRLSLFYPEDGLCCTGWSGTTKLKSSCLRESGHKAPPFPKIYIGS